MPACCPYLPACTAGGGTCPVGCTCPGGYPSYLPRGVYQGGVPAQGGVRAGGVPAQGV